MTVGDEFANDPRFAHRELEQTSNPIDPAATRARHAIEGVCDAPHPMLKRGARVVFPCVAVTAAGRDVAFTQFIDQGECAGKFRSKRHSFDHAAVIEQRSVDASSRFSH